MVSRVTVSLPDDLQEKLKEYGVNPSKLFQQAAKKLILEKTALQKNREQDDNEVMPKETEMQAYIEKARKAKARASELEFRDGRKEGISFASAYDYITLCDAVKMAKEIKDFDRHYNYVTYDMFGDSDNGDIYTYFKECLDYEFESLDTEPYPLKEESKQWILGWCDGVLDFWDKLPEDLKN